MSGQPNDEELEPKVKTLALCTTADVGDIVYKLVEFTDFDGIVRRELMPATHAENLGNIKSFLLNKWFPNPTARDDWSEIQTELKRIPDSRVLLVSRTGFHGDDYLSPKNRVYKTIPKILLNPSATLHLPLVSKKGTLEEWKANVARPAKHSSICVLSLCGAFASNLLDITGIESGGFHI
ncbi:MAG: DUF927 domain-containing protein [Magnetococcales bacterium]|nr:DUF927 domain-containing protein [Magnetococcales bacterium]